MTNLKFYLFIFPLILIFNFIIFIALLCKYKKLNKDEIFFDVFAKSAENTIFICNMLGNFDKTEKSLNSIYSATDKEKSEQQRYFNLLEKAFITPIERELLLETSVKFLDFSERVKDIAASVYYTGIYEKQTAC